MLLCHQSYPGVQDPHTARVSRLLARDHLESGPKEGPPPPSARPCSFPYHLAHFYLRNTIHVVRPLPDTFRRFSVSHLFLPIYQRRMSSSHRRGIHSMCVSAEVHSSYGTDHPPGAREEALVGMVKRPMPLRSSGRGQRQFLVLEDVEPLGHQAVQFRAVAVQVVQHLADGRLHRLEHLMPPVQRRLPQELPRPLDQVQVGRAGRQEHQVELPMARQPLLGPPARCRTSLRPGTG